MQGDPAHGERPPHGNVRRFFLDYEENRNGASIPAVHRRPRDPQRVANGDCKAESAPQIA